MFPNFRERLVGSQIRQLLHGGPSVRSWNWIRHNPAFGITAEVVRRQIAETCFFSAVLHDLPNDFLGHFLYPDFAGTTDAAK
jgi:hypothetical protein